MGFPGRTFGFLLIIVTLHSVRTSIDGPPRSAFTDRIKQGSQNVRLQRNWLSNAIVPSYLHEFLKNFKTDDSDWHHGVQSQSCIDDVTRWVTKLKEAETDLETLASDENKWVIQMIDAWGKIPEGILSGHVSVHGDFDQCVQVTARADASFEGLYCSVYAADYASAMNITPVPPTDCSSSSKNDHGKDSETQESVSVGEFFDIYTGKSKTWLPLLPSIGICMPNTCSTDDVQQILVNFVHKFLKCSLYPWPATVNCTDRHKPSFDAATIIVIIMLVFLVTLAVVAGSLDYFYDNYIAGPRPNSRPYQYLMAFSIYTNTKKLLSTRKSAEDLGCIHGIRFLSTAWVVLAHTYFAFMGAPLWNLIDMKNINKNWTSLAVINGTFSVDTFFTMSGFLGAYSLLKMLDKTKGKINILMFYVHRYIRLTPVYLILVGIGATLISYAGNGPNWFAVKVDEDHCRKNWWTNILYINNLVNSDEMCNGESWYLANDMQFYILAPFIVYPIWKWETMGLILLTIYSILSCISQVLVVRYGPAPPALVVTGAQDESEDVTKIYYRPWTRIAPFLVGVWLGWIMHKTKGKTFRLPLAVVISSWIACTGLALTIIFGIYPWFDVNYEIPHVSGYFYGGLSRFSWGVVIAWIIFACVKGYGGFVNRFLSWKGFMPLGRLCFCIYLTSVHLQVIFHNRLTVPIKWDTYTVVHLYFAHMVMSCLSAFVCTILFESPFIVLQKLIFEGEKGSKHTVVGGTKMENIPDKITISNYENLNNNNNVVSSVKSK